VSCTTTYAEVLSEFALAEHTLRRPLLKKPIAPLKINEQI
jgi:hypothetical protein